MHFIHLISLSYNEAVISFSLDNMSSICIEDITANEVLAQTTEKNSVGRITLNPLLPDTNYKLNLSFDSGSEIIEFKSLPHPVGPMMRPSARVNAIQCPFDNGSTSISE